MRENLDRMFMPKFGGHIEAGCGSRSGKFYFKDGFQSQRDRSYQVTRAEFDKLLLDHARSAGAEVREETAVKQISFGSDRVQLEIGGADDAAAHSSNRVISSTAADGRRSSEISLA